MFTLAVSRGGFRDQRVADAANEDPERRSRLTCLPPPPVLADNPALRFVAHAPLPPVYARLRRPRRLRYSPPSTIFSLRRVEESGAPGAVQRFGFYAS